MCEIWCSRVLGTDCGVCLYLRLSDLAGEHGLEARRSPTTTDREGGRPWETEASSGKEYYVEVDRSRSRSRNWSRSRRRSRSRNWSRSRSRSRSRSTKGSLRTKGNVQV